MVVAVETGDETVVEQCRTDAGGLQRLHRQRRIVRLRRILRGGDDEVGDGIGEAHAALLAQLRGDLVVARRATRSACGSNNLHRTRASCGDCALACMAWNSPSTLASGARSSRSRPSPTSAPASMPHCSSDRVLGEGRRDDRGRSRASSASRQQADGSEAGMVVMAGDQPAAPERCGSNRQPSAAFAGMTVKGNSGGNGAGSRLRRDDGQWQGRSNVHGSQPSRG